jgi:hypothetical protein
VFEKEISGYDLELTQEFIIQFNNVVSIAKFMMLKINGHVPWLEETESR